MLEEKHISLFKGEACNKRIRATDSAWIEARQVLRNYAEGLNEYEILFAKDDAYLLADSKKSVKSIMMHWEFLSGFVVFEQSMNADDYKVVGVYLTPKEFNESFATYTVGGMLMGGVTGALIGSVIDSLPHERRDEAHMDVTFAISNSIWSRGVNFPAIPRRDIVLSENGIRQFLREAEPYITQLQERFPDKFSSFND